MQTSNLSIRMARKSDFDAWLVLWKGYQQFYKTQIDDATSMKTWERFLDSSEPMHCAVAEVNNNLIGIAHYIFHRSCWTIGDYVYLQDLFVDPASRGAGTGRVLIEHVYTEAKKLGASRVWWLTHETNQDAMYLYDEIADKSGFIQYRKVF